MKKIILTAVLTASLLANETNGVDANNTASEIQNTQVVPVDAQSASSGITTKDVAVAIGVPIFVAGAVVAAVAVSPIWLVKKVFE